MSNLTEREKILTRIREALRVPAPKPGHGKAPKLQFNGSPPSSHAKEWLPRTGTTTAEHVALFTKTAVDLKAEVVVVADEQAMLAVLKSLRDTERWTSVATHSGGLTNSLVPELGLQTLRTDAPYDTAALERCNAGISECDALVAQTGSVLVTSVSAGGRALSVLPPHHVVLARTSQLLADLPEAFALLRGKYGTGFPSFISFITGPSRTGDIERILVLGAHGPKRLTVIVISDIPA